MIACRSARRQIDARAHFIEELDSNLVELERTMSTRNNEEWQMALYPGFTFEFGLAYEPSSHSPAWRRYPAFVIRVVGFFNQVGLPATRVPVHGLFAILINKVGAFAHQHQFESLELQNVVGERLRAILTRCNLGWIERDVNPDGDGTDWQYIL